MLVKDDYSKFIYSIDVNNSVEYFCESAPTSDFLREVLKPRKAWLFPQFNSQ